MSGVQNKNVAGYDYVRKFRTPCVQAGAVVRFQEWGGVLLAFPDLNSLEMVDVCHGNSSGPS